MKRTITFFTGLFLAFSITLWAADVNIAAGANLQAEIEAANEGDVFILADGDYVFVAPPEGEGGDNYIDISKSVTIKAANAGAAVLSKYQFRVNKDTIANITFDGIVSSDDATKGNYFIQFVDAESVVENLIFKNCEISAYGRGVIRATVNKTARLDSILIDNCVFSDLSIQGPGYAQINPQKSSIKTITIKNSTFYNSKAAVFRYTEAGAETITAVIENCTVLNCGSVEGRKMVELASDNVKSFEIKNCIFSGTFNADTIPEKKSIDLVNVGTIDNCLLEGFSNPLTAKVTPTNQVESTVASFNFITKEIRLTPEVTGIGDPRWTLVNEVTPEPALTISETALEFTPENLNATFTVTGSDLLGDITISAPAGITLASEGVVLSDDGSLVLEKEALEAGEITVTVTFDGETEVKGNISVSGESINETIAVTVTLPGSGFGQINIAKTVKTIENFDFTGKRLSSEAQGLIIRKITYTDGSTAVRKVYVEKK